MHNFISTTGLVLFAASAFAEHPGANQAARKPALKLIEIAPETASSSLFNGVLINGKAIFHRTTPTGNEKVEKDYSLEHAPDVSLDCKTFTKNEGSVVCSLVIYGSDFNGTFGIIGEKVGDQITFKDSGFENIPLETGTVRLLPSESKLILDSKTNSIARGSRLSFQELSTSTPPQFIT